LDLIASTSNKGPYGQAAAINALTRLPRFSHSHSFASPSIPSDNFAPLCMELTHLG